MDDTLSGQLPEVTAKIEEMVRTAFPQVRFTDIWVRPGISPWFGDAVVHIWAIYDGEVDDLFRSPDKPSFGSRVQDMLCDRIWTSCRGSTSSRRRTRGTGALKASDFLTTAERQLPAGPGRPLESDLRRSLSTAYYALFHCLAGCCADTLIGRTERKTGVWRRT